MASSATTGTTYLTNMVKLSSKARKDLPAKDFAVAGRKFPIEDKSHARNALSRAGAKGGKVEAEVKQKVKEKFPGIKVGGKRGTSTGYMKGCG